MVFSLSVICAVNRWASSRLTAIDSRVASKALSIGTGFNSSVIDYSLLSETSDKRVRASWQDGTSLPQAHRFIKASSSQRATVMRKGDRRNLVSMIQRLFLYTSLRVPQDDCGIVAAARQELAVSGEGE